MALTGELLPGVPIEIDLPLVAGAVLAWNSTLKTWQSSLPLQTKNPNTLHILGDSLMARNYTVGIVSQVAGDNTIAGGILTTKLSSGVANYPGGVGLISNVYDSSGADLTGTYQCVARTSASVCSFLVGRKFQDGVCSTPGIAANNLQLNLNSLADNGPVTWGNIFSKQKFEVVGVSTYGGWTAEQLLTRVSEVLASGANHCALLAGTNNVVAGQPASYFVPIVLKIATLLRAAGVTVELFTLPPFGAPSASIAKNQQIVEANKAFRFFAKTTPGVLLVDAYATLIDPMSGTAGLPKAGVLVVDGIHWSPLGAFLVGQVFNTATASVPLIDDRVMSNVDNYGAGAASSNLTDYAPWAAVGGTVTAPIVGTIGAGFTALRGGGIAVGAASCPARADGFGYDATIVVTPTANGDYSRIFSSTGVVAARVNTNTKYRYDVSVSVSGLAGSNYNQFYNWVQGTLDGVSISMAYALNASQTGTMPTTDWSGVLRSPWFSWSGALSTAITMDQRAFFSAAGTDLTHSVGRFSFQKMIF